MQRSFTVTATWDAEAHVFTSRSDIPGLVAEAETFEDFVTLIEALAPEVITANVPDAPRHYAVNVEAPRELAMNSRAISQAWPYAINTCARRHASQL